MAWGITVSLLVHGLVVVPWLFVEHLHAAPPPRQTLSVDILGMLAKRQLSAQQLAAVQPPPGATPPVMPSQPPKPRPSAQAARVAPRHARSKDAEVSAAPKPAAPAPAAAQPPVVAAAAPAANVEVGKQVQVAQTLQAARVQPSVDDIRRYLARLKRMIEQQLVYPDEARLGGYSGSPVIRFGIDEAGNIKPGSLTIQKSSGYGVLDDQALRAALASAPLPVPPRAMAVAIGVSFSRER